MSQIKTFFKKSLIPLSLIVCLFIILLFTFSVLNSRRDIPTALQDVYGDTSGIHGLTISGRVSDMQKHFSYEFKIDENNNMLWTNVYNSENDVSNNIMTNKYYFSSFTYNPPFLANYIPIEPYKTEIIKNRNSIHDSMSSSSTNTNTGSSNGIPPIEYRIYAKTYEVFTYLNTVGCALKLDKDKNRLYYTQNERSYIYFSEYGNYYFGEYKIGDGYVYLPKLNEEGSVIYQDSNSQTSFSIRRSSSLPCFLSIGDIELIVPVGQNLFGHTALYIVELQNRVVPIWHEDIESDPLVEADELYPIELEYGKDEILGLIEIENGVLLAIRRGDDFELVRINLKTREAISITAKDIPYYVESFFISGDSIIFLSSRQGTTCHDIWVFNLSEEGLEHVLTIEAANLWDMDESQTDYHYIADVIWKDNMLYVAEFRNSFWNFTNEAHISSFSQDGTLVGRCKLLCGVEEDSSSFWFAGRGSIQSTYMRSLQTIIIMNK